MPELPGGKVDARNTNGRPDLGHASLCTPPLQQTGKDRDARCADADDDDDEDDDDASDTSTL